MTPSQLADTVTRIIAELSDAGTIPAVDVPEVRIERPKSREHGDYATNVALALAKQVGMAPRDLATLLVAHLERTPGVASAEVAGPGFVNIRLDSAAQGEVARRAVDASDAWGHSDTLAGTTINVEFISANPTGPLHLGHTRWAALGDAIARVLAAAGATVATEFYINDRGAQLEKFGASVMAIANGRPVPEDGYHGDYILELAARIVAEHPEYLELPDDEQLVAFREAAYALQLDQQKQVLDLFRTHFDVWASERELHESGAVERGLARLREQGHVFEQEGAVWLRTTDFGDDKDRVLIRGDGSPTYFASDTAYYVDKRARGFDVNIYLLGADHHGYVNRLRAVAACAGDDMDVNVEVLIGQLVKITRAGEEVKLSKRAGTIVTLDELVQEVGVDAARYTLSRYPADSPAHARHRGHDPGHQRQPGVLRAVRARADRVRPAQRGRARHRLARAGVRPVAARPRAGEQPARDDRGVPSDRGVGCGAAGAASRRPLPRGPGDVVPPVLRRVLGAAARRRGAGADPRRPAVVVRGVAADDRERAGPAGRQRAGADVAAAADAVMGFMDALPH